MPASVVSLFVAAASLAQYAPPQSYYGHGPIKKDELEYQQQTFKQWWGDELVLKLADLPKEGKVPDFRQPYAGHDYPDRAGGTMSALFKYDRAFHAGRPLAAEHERMDVIDHRGGGREEEVIRGFFGRVRTVRNRVPTWYGHCNGWTAAAIRHAEPQKSVIRNGVLFTPADIKGLLAEIYMYTESEFLGGVDPAINPATLHLTLSNWLGRGSHPVGMETAVGEVVINFPIFGYKSIVNQFAPRQAEIKTTITYALNINREMDKAPPNYNRQLYFHYVVDLDEAGAIRGGRYYGDSGQIDMLWTPLKPTQGGEEKNVRGNPHLNVKEVLAIWRESVPDDVRQKWLNIDPTDEDRILPKEPPKDEALVKGDAPKSDTATSTSARRDDAQTDGSVENAETTSAIAVTAPATGGPSAAATEPAASAAAAEASPATGTATGEGTSPGENPSR